MDLGFRDGVRAVFRGARRLFGDRTFAKTAALPVLLTLVLQAVGLTIAAFSVDDLLARFWAPPTGAALVLWTLLAIVMFLALWVVLALTFVALAMAVSGPFHEQIAGKILDDHRVLRRDLGFFRGLGVDVAWALIVAVPAATLGLLALLPGIGVALAAASITIASFGLAIASVGPALNATGRGFGARFGLLRARTRFIAGSALVLAAALIVPALGLLAVPAAVIGLTERLIEAGEFPQLPSQTA